jgi:1,2-diacylglycerol 3-alpha-glucosyltransferase
MRIALFTETYLPYTNGVVTHVKILKEGLEKLGHEVLVVCADVDTRRHYIKDGVLHCPGRSFKRFYEYGLASPISTTRLRYIKRFNPDIIHIHNEFGVGFSGAMIAKILKKPLVYTLHTMYDEYLYYVAPRPFIPIVRKTSHQYLRFLARGTMAITGPSKKVEEFFKECGVKKMVNVIPNPVELDIFEPDNIDPGKKHEFRKKYNIEDDVTLACFCGRLGKEKSVDVMLNFWAETVKPTDKLKLLIIGDGPSKESLEKQAKKLGIDEMVIFTGKVMHDDLPPYYASCDCYITTSLSDTNSISMLEAMATGLPVLHLYDELNEGQIKPGINGFIFHDAKEMYEELIGLKNKSETEKQTLHFSVRDSVKQSGAENLANYLLTIYNNAFHS